MSERKIDLLKRLAKACERQIENLVYKEFVEGTGNYDESDIHLENITIKDLYLSYLEEIEP